MPVERSRRMMANSRSASVVDRLDVGSSRIRTEALAATARAMAINWRSAGRPVLPQSSSSKRFSATVRPAAPAWSVAWCTVAMPAALAALGEAKVAALPFSVIVPASGVCEPERIFTSVDLPAPLAPISATTSPAATARSAPASARVGPKDFSIPATETVMEELGRDKWLQPVTGWERVRPGFPWPSGAREWTGIASLILHDRQLGIVTRRVDDAIGIDEHIGRLHSRTGLIASENSGCEFFNSGSISALLPAWFLANDRRPLPGIGSRETELFQVEPPCSKARDVQSPN